MTLTPEAQKVSEKIRLWVESTNPDPTPYLQAAYLRSEAHEEPKAFVSAKETTTASGHKCWHLEVENDNQKETIQFIRLCEDNILRLPNGSPRVPIDKDGIPTLPGWLPAEPKEVWHKNSGKEVKPLHESRSAIIDSSGYLWNKDDLTWNWEETRLGKLEKIKIECEIAVWGAERTKIQEACRKAQIKHETILIRYIQKLSYLDGVAQTENRYEDCARYRKVLNAEFHDLSRCSDAIINAQWVATNNMAAIPVETRGGQTAILNSNGNVTFSNPTSYCYSISWENFQKNRDLIFKEAAKATKEPKRPKQKAVNKNEDTEPQNDIEQEPKPLAFVLEVEPGRFSCLLNSDQAQGIYGAVSSTGFYSQHGKEEAEAEKTLRDAASSLKPVKTKKKTKSDPTKSFDQITLETIPAGTILGLLAGTDEENFYNYYHPIQASVDAKRALESLKLVEEAQAKLNPKEKTITLRQAAELLDGVHAPSSQAYSLKWIITRKIHKAGRNLVFTEMVKGNPAMIQPFQDTERSWQEKAEKQKTVRTTVRTLTGKVTIKGKDTIFVSRQWDPKDPDSILSILQEETEEAETTPTSTAPKPEQMELFALAA